MKDRFLEGESFEAYLEGVENNAELWRALYERARIPDDVVEAARKALDGPVHLLALSEDWCGDAVNTLPVVARFAERLEGVELRVLSRDGNPDLMDTHLTDGRSRSIPVIMVLDEDFRETGWWGPRPAELQEWVLANLDLPSDERYREVRRWYVRDRGRTLLTELLEVMVADTARL